MSEKKKDSTVETKKGKKKLVLSKETVTALTLAEDDLAQVVGGALPWCTTNTGGTCHTCG